MKKLKKNHRRSILTLFLVSIFLISVIPLVESAEAKITAKKQESSTLRDTNRINRINLEEVKLFDESSKQKRINQILRYGSPVSITGSAEVIIYDDFENKRSDSAIFINDGSRYRIYFGKTPRLKSGMILNVKGTSFKDEIVVQDYELLGSTSTTAENPNLGEQRTAVILVNSIANPIEPITPSEAWERVFSETYNPNNDDFIDSINGYVKEVSHGKAWMDGNVFGWYTLNLNEVELCPHALGAAIAIADPDIDYTQFNRLIVVAPTANCIPRAYGSIGMEQINTNDGLVSFSTSVLIDPNFISSGGGAHEFGHNLGVWHANYLDCDSETIGTNCISYGYADRFDIMGQDFLYGHFNAMHMNTIGWFDQSNTLIANTNGIYKIEPIETNTLGIKNLIIPTPNYDYSLEFRRKIGYDNIVAEDLNWINGVFDGAFFHTDQFFEMGDTQLLDLTPNMVNGHPTTDFWLDSADVILKEGKTFYDQENNIKITTLSVTDNYLEICLGELTDCNRPPELNSIGNKIVYETEQLSIQLTATDPDENILTYGTNANGILPSAFSFDANTGLFQWTPQLGDFGTYEVTFSVTDSQLSDEETITITVNELPLNSPSQEPSPIKKNRYISLIPTNPGRQTALKVTLTSLHHFSSLNAPDFSAYENQVRYIGPPQEYTDSTLFGTTFIASPLVCEPYYQDWSNINLLHIFGDEIVPSSIYNIVSINQNQESIPLVVETTQWGDIDGNNQVNVLDISKIVDKVKDLPGALSKVQTQLEPQNLNPAANVNVLDIATAVDSLKSKPYPFSITNC